MLHLDLKKEQALMKERLVELVEYVNSEEYYSLSSNEKSLINQQMVGMEISLNAMSNRLYGNDSINGMGGMAMMPFLMSMLSSPWNSSTSNTPSEVTVKDFEGITETETTSKE